MNATPFVEFTPDDGSPAVRISARAIKLERAFQAALEERLLREEAERLAHASAFFSGPATVTPFGRVYFRAAMADGQS